MTIFLVYTSPFSVAQFLRDIIDIITKAAVEKPLKSQHLIAYEDCGIEKLTASVCVFIVACRSNEEDRKWVFNLIFKINKKGTRRGKLIEVGKATFEGGNERWWGVEKKKRLFLNTALGVARKLSHAAWICEVIFLN